MRFDPTEILRVLARHKVRYVLVGGMAATIHGYDGVTTDLDIAPEVTATNLRRLSAALDDLGARVRTEGEPDGLPFAHDAESLRAVTIWNLVTRAGDLDLTFQPSGTGGYRDLRADAVAIEVHGIPTVVASLADVVRSKEAADRPKDRLALPELRRLLGDG